MKSKITAAVSAVLVLMTGAAAAVINTQTLSLGTSTIVDGSKVASTSDIQIEQSAALTSSGTQTSLPAVVVPDVAITPTPVVTVTVTPKVVVQTPKQQATSGGSSYSNDDNSEVKGSHESSDEGDDD